MEFLRDLFGNFTSGIIRLAVAVGILAAAYLFIVKPVLHTTETVSNTVNDSIQSANESFNESFGPHSETGRAIRRANRQVRIQIHRSFHQANVHGNPQKMIKCIQRANVDVHRIQRCSVRFSP
jgi:F0F1-type ATP synthase membrane subunit b/b'